ncbi:MAG: hypothetical protein LBS29_04860 [Endomicrobium sp.]|jgi:DNA polymerase I-like protein with 3'-5' exonuclease and polymerase domains|nr:hypothetical protein [Endomicrobium sp.]
MIKITDKKLPLTPAEVRSILQQETDTFGCFFDLYLILGHEADLLLNIHKNRKQWISLTGDPYLKITDRNRIMQLLVQRFNVPSYKLQADDSGQRFSIEKEIVASLIADVSINEDAKEFLRLFQKMKEWSQLVSYLGQYKELPVSVAESCDKHRMVIAHPLWSLLATSRISASSPSLQNVASSLLDIYTAPEGYTMISCDSSQIEPRITYSAFIRDEDIIHLIKMYDDAYYGLLHYITLGKDAAKFDINEEVKNKRDKLKTLALAGNYGSSNLASIDYELGPSYTEKIVRHPLRLALERNVRERVKSGADTFYGIFGTPVKPEETNKYKKNGTGWFEHLVRCGVNNPIQTTASELMCFSVYNAKKVLGSEGKINYYKHDEGCFYVPEDKVDYYAGLLKECVAYEVEGWLPIGSDLHIGRKLTE